MPRSWTMTASQRSRTSRNTGSRSYSDRPMPGHWLPCPVYTNATRAAAAVAGAWLPSATARRPSRSDAASLKTTPARQAMWLRPLPAVQAMSDKQGFRRGAGRLQLPAAVVEPRQVTAGEVPHGVARSAGQRQQPRGAGGGGCGGRRLGGVLASATRRRAATFP